MKSNRPVGYSEKELEQLLFNKKHLDCIEDGLVCIDRQVRTKGSTIDLLCVDKDEIYVVMELKVAPEGFLAIGQLQSYITAYQELHPSRRIRGILFSPIDKMAKYAVKGSRYDIKLVELTKKENV